MLSADESRRDHHAATRLHQLNGRSPRPLGALSPSRVALDGVPIIPRTRPSIQQNGAYASA